MSPRVVLFIRYPEPGKAKTRVTPAPGAAGALANGCSVWRAGRR